MKSIDEKIARSEAEWHRYRYENMGVRESTALLCSSLKKSLKKRMGGAVKRACSSGKEMHFQPTYDESRENIVISLTSTEDRVRYIFPTLCSLISQTKKADLIVLWLGKDSCFPKETVNRIWAMGVVVRFKKDLGSYTKYHYAFRRFKNDLVITVDDDIIYHGKMVQELYETHLKHPDLVIARRVNKMRFNPDRRLASYKDWIWEYRDAKVPSFDLLATGVGGVLYPPSVMALKCWENEDFLKVCPQADDIWLKFCQLSSDAKVCPVKGARFEKDVINQRAQRISLSSENVDRGLNDERIKACAKYFGMKDDLCERVLSE
ncbi:MAG: glycosyltransferase [Lachnospiraceae bacterium]|nr:glycosyltransferase [Lachnospiraceae bacterium]